MNFIDAFRSAISAAGLEPPDQIIADGSRQRFSTNGRSTDKSGWYRLHGDAYPAGSFGCWRSGISCTWKHDVKREFSAEERAAWKKRMAEMEAQREAERKEAAEYAAKTAAQMWVAAREDAGHDYLARKKIPALGARVLKDMVLIPIKQSAKELVGLQRIWPDGTKRPIKGTPMVGAYTVIGKPEPKGRVVICEGWATGVSIHMATKLCVVVAFNSGNLAPVAAKIAKMLPTAELVLAADDDAFTVYPPNHPKAGQPWNPGRESALATGLPVYMPRWYGDRGEGTDFNDLHLAEGLGAVAECFAEPITPSPQPEPEPEPEAPQPVPAPTTPTPPAQTQRQVDYFSPLVHVTDKGKPLAVIENLLEIANRLGITLRYNVISKEEEILIPRAGFSLDNRQNASLAWLISECAKFRMPVDRVSDFVTFIADCNQYNPVAQWIQSKPWDGEDRLQLLMHTVEAKEQAKNPAVVTMKEVFIRKWMLSAVAAAFRPTGVSAHGVLVFQGAQYVGKTKWFKSLVPEELGVLKDGMLLRPDDRDSVMKCVSNWLVELGELDATFRKSDIASLKSFLTSDRDVLRRAYARKESSFARRTVFFASVNPKNYLHDETGNRRYWTIEVDYLDYDHGLDMQQVWAQVYELYKQGQTWFLSPEELGLLNEHNKDFEVIDPIEDLICNGLNWDEPEVLWRWESATELLVSLGRQNPTKGDTTRVGMVCRRLNGDRARRQGSGRFLFVPPKKVKY